MQSVQAGKAQADTHLCADGHLRIALAQQIIIFLLSPEAQHNVLSNLERLLFMDTCRLRTI